ncbi:MAG: toprim domain-containing protein, partial [Candidatus Nomurabacteria bacterium]|nr:toprim domain-containing protein [Candidatus Nomurabacteria bacterium]
KRFTKGLSKKGHFALIGMPSLPEKIPTIHVCEGVATAASIHRAIGEPVFAALDAFNLHPVCKSLKRHYPKTQIIIWADNDWKKADRTTKFGRVLGNTGLIQANRTAFKLRGTLVCTPDFSTFDSELIKEATDFNDLGATKDNASNALDLGAIRKNMDIDPKDVEALKIAQEAIEKQNKI